MAYVRKRGTTYRVEIQRNGVRESETFDTRAEAAAWALKREAEVTGKRIPGKTLDDALARYAKDVSPTKRGARWEIVRIAKLRRDGGIAKRRLSDLTADDFATWRDSRNKQVSPASTAREMNLLGAVLETARKDWGWLTVNPMSGVRRPADPPPRRRRVSEAEIFRICAALGYTFPNKPENISHRVALAFLFAIETAMRAGEVLSLNAKSIHLKERYVELPRTKNGDARQVSLSLQAVRILRLVGDGFGIDPAVRDALFRRARKIAQIDDLHFHDSRAEAIWRLSKKLDVLQLARMIGHRDIRSLMFYYNEHPTDIAKRLD